MKLEIVRYGHPALRQPGKPVKSVTPDIRALAANMIETMRDARGVGLAAQQVGLPLRLCVLDVQQDEDRPSRLWIEGRETPVGDPMPMALLNPEILKSSRQKETGTEGCLSFPEISAEIRRAHRVTVRATGLDGEPMQFECDGLLARAVQHELDHLQGVLFIDRMDSATKLSLRKDLEALREETESSLRHAPATV